MSAEGCAQRANGAHVLARAREYVCVCVCERERESAVGDEMPITN